MVEKRLVLLHFFLFFIIIIGSFISANNYSADVYFTVPDTVFVVSERIEFKGYLYLTNLTSNGIYISNHSALANTNVNMTITYRNGSLESNYTFVTDSNGTFYSKSNYYTSATEINASSVPGNYTLRAEYKDLNNGTWFSEFEIIVVNSTIDFLYVSSEKAKYNPSESVLVNIEAIKRIGDKILHIANVSVSGTLRNSSKDSLSTFSCITGNNGICSVTLTAPSTYGDYILELNDFKAIGNFRVVPFSANVYMKDEIGQSLKNVYAVGEQGKVEVSIVNASDSDVYTFSGYIYDSSGNVVKAISSTTLNSNNSFTNTFLFTVDPLLFSYGTYTSRMTISKTGDGSMNSSASFEVKDWTLSINKRSSNSGFEYEYSIFSNKPAFFEIYPIYRSNGSIIQNLSVTYFIVNVKDNLNNVLSSSNVTWNSSCGNNGCYEFNITSPINTGQYSLSVVLSNNGATATETRTISVINTIISSQSTDKDGNLKELFGASEYIYLSLTSYNTSDASINLSDAEVFVVEYMNGTQFSYTSVGNFSLVNSSNSVYEWAWNSTSQRIKLDVPKIGGLYNVYLFGNNRTVGAVSKFIVNPYDVCSVPKNTPGTVSSGYYYIWQFKTTDTVYFEIKITQADNSLGKANVLNQSSGNGTGIGSSCSYSVDTSTKQTINNATVAVLEVKNLESGSVQSFNSTDSVCQSEDNSGGYTCTVKPLNKWEGGVNIDKFIIQGEDGTEDLFYSRFESRAFYMYGWCQQWQNNPTSNISLTVQLYEAGNGWWGSYGSGGLSGTMTVKRVEYQGRDGEWIWPPVDSGYNVSNVPSTSITSGQGTIMLNASYAPGGIWKTGYYRVVLEGKTTAGDTDYGYAWFGIKLWDVYGQPVECDADSCDYKSYFNSKENVTLYIKISKAGLYSYSYSGGEDIYGNVTVGVKKIQDCRTSPCKELNSSQYKANTINVNSSSKWYWNSNLSNANNYLLKINVTSGTWGTGWYSVVLDVNGTDTGYAWFNTIAFYVDVRPTDAGGINYTYSIKPSQPKYFNVTTTKNYRGWNAIYNISDYINTTIEDIVLRTWDQTTWQQKEYNYPEDISITPLSANGSAFVNITYNNGNWPNGYYSGELTLKNSDNEISTGRLWFNVKPFRISTSVSSYSLDDDQCVNATLNIYEPSWYSNSHLYGNYSITNVYEDIWTYGGRSRTNYTNYTTDYLNATANITVCPNGTWSSEGWGGYHYLAIVVKDNSDNSTENGWMSFRAMPFRISWGSIVGGIGQLTSANIIVPVNISKYSTGASSSGNLTEIYQWRYDNYRSTRESYIFSVDNCYSNVSGQCNVTGYHNVTIYAPSDGWRTGYNYLYTVWTKQNDSSLLIQDSSGVYFDGRMAYNGYFNNYDRNRYYKYNFLENENLTIGIYVRDLNYNAANVNVTGVQYALSSDGCWDDWCRTYTSATFSLVSGNSSVGSDGEDVIDIQVPSSNWTNGNYYIKATVSGANGTSTITGGSLRVKDMVAPNTTISTPSINQTINESTYTFNATTSESATCSFSVIDYGSFYSWYCSSINSTNSSVSSGLVDSCNTTKYGFDNSTGYYYEYVSKDYHSASSGANYDYWYQSGVTGMITNGMTHGYVLNTTNKVNNSILTIQDYAINVWCYDADWNYGSAYTAFTINVTN